MSARAQKRLSGAPAVALAPGSNNCSVCVAFGIIQGSKTKVNMGNRADTNEAIHKLLNWCASFGEPFGEMPRTSNKQAPP
mmetsp:Transcript_10118/g.20746  ORF Transcript_10118/g.20746 Transcript_10118/m.20746 type:complete len:80 (+) Transcript_10118:135-374(+)